MSGLCKDCRFFYLDGSCFLLSSEDFSEDIAYDEGIDAVPLNIPKAGAYVSGGPGATYETFHPSPDWGCIQWESR